MASVGATHAQLMQALRSFPAFWSIRDASILLQVWEEETIGDQGLEEGLRLEQLSRNPKHAPQEPVVQ